MIILIPMSVVVLATFLRCVVAMWGVGKRKLVRQIEEAAVHRQRAALGEPVSAAAEAALLANQSAAQLYGLLQPLVFAYMAAPVLGALGTVWTLGRVWRGPIINQPKLLADSIEQAFIPMGFGLLVSLCAVVFYATLKARILKVEHSLLLPAAHNALPTPGGRKSDGRRL